MVFDDVVQLRVKFGGALFEVTFYVFLDRST